MPKQQFEKSSRLCHEYHFWSCGAKAGTIFDEGDCRAGKKVCNEIMHIHRPVLVIFLVWNLVHISICKWTPHLKKAFFTGPRCLWGPVYGSRPLYKTFVKLCWCDSGLWWYQLNTIDDANIKQSLAICTQWHIYASGTRRWSKQTWRNFTTRNTTSWVL